MLIFGVWLGWKVNKARQQREAVEEIESVGGIVWYDYQALDDRRWDETIDPPWPAWLETILGRDFLYDAVGVDLSGEPLFEASEDSDGIRLRHAMRQASELNQLRVLEVCVASREGFAALERFTNIRRLVVYISINPLYHGELDRDIASLGKLRNLTELDLAAFGLGDGGLRQLESLSRLRFLGLDYTSVTSDGLQRLKEALPTCEIYGW